MDIEILLQYITLKQHIFYTCILEDYSTRHSDNDTCTWLRKKYRHQHRTIKPVTRIIIKFRTLSNIWNIKGSLWRGPQEVCTGLEDCCQYHQNIADLKKKYNNCWWKVGKSDTAQILVIKVFKIRKKKCSPGSIY